MKHFDDIYEIAADNYGLVTYAEAKKAGITGGELNRWVSQGRLERRGHGVYRLTRRTPEPYDRYAEAVCLVGQDAVVWGDSVLAMLGLAYENPPVVYVAPARRVRRKLPSWVKVVKEPVKKRSAYEGVPCQVLPEAILACKGHVLPERLLAAVRDAVARGFITKSEAAELEKGIA
ncbi:MAG: type IV toxin-antitoxin system AbiEi family antitoxin domain-containing protein [Coriobacteriales bacterium]|jgi:predicted transcriptional regulator of viral defense system